MEINVKTIEDVTVVEIAGEIDGKTAPEAQKTILPLAAETKKIMLELSKVEYMSSAGLRMLLMLYRQIVSGDEQIILVGVPELIQDVMSHTGFLRFFTLCDSVEDGIAKMK